MGSENTMLIEELNENGIPMEPKDSSLLSQESKLTDRILQAEAEKPQFEELTPEEEALIVAAMKEFAATLQEAEMEALEFAATLQEAFEAGVAAFEEETKDMSDEEIEAMLLDELKAFFDEDAVKALFVEDAPLEDMTPEKQEDKPVQEQDDEQIQL